MDTVSQLSFALILERVTWVNIEDEKSFQDEAYYMISVIMAMQVPLEVQKSDKASRIQREKGTQSVKALLISPLSTDLTICDLTICNTNFILCPHCTIFFNFMNLVTCLSGPDIDK